ncbi:hypothetical protein V9T40_008450 [Parthenolecanium corni]|uniref:BHLH domain-containing protein n=1 Tax=Parthenolecanium corni TaxID=536013 RepID=A0AAN9Y752_9HEMI
MEKRADQITSKKSTTSAAGTSGGGSSSSCGDDDDYFPAAKKSRPSHRIGCDEKPRELKRAAADKVSTSPRRSRNGGGGAAASGSRHASPSTKAGSAMNATTNTTGTTAATVATVVPTAATVAASTTAMLTTTVVPSSTSPSKDGKRANKPLMEKRRRARINQSLALLKTLILDSTKNDNTRHSKLEKADILELTVRYLQRQKILNSDVLDKYKAGFQECTREVTRFLDTPELHLCGDSSKCMKNQPNGTIKTSNSNSVFIEPAVKQRLLRHLNSCSSEIDLDFSKSESLQDNPSEPKSPAERSTTPAFPTNDISSNGRESPPSIKSEETGTDTDSSSQKNLPFENNEDSTLSVVQVIPSRLSDGQVVFLLPSHYMQLAEFQKKANSCPKRSQEDSNEPLDFSIKREGCMWRPCALSNHIRNQIETDADAEVQASINRKRPKQ